MRCFFLWLLGSPASPGGFVRYRSNGRIAGIPALGALLLLVACLNREHLPVVISTFATVPSQWRQVTIPALGALLPLVAAWLAIITGTRHLGGETIELGTHILCLLVGLVDLSKNGALRVHGVEAHNLEQGAPGGLILGVQRGIPRSLVALRQVLVRNAVIMRAELVIPLQDLLGVERHIAAKLHSLPEGHPLPKQRPRPDLPVRSDLVPPPKLGIEAVDVLLPHAHAPREFGPPPEEVVPPNNVAGPELGAPPHGLAVAKRHSCPKLGVGTDVVLVTEHGA
mmetsp:Transcript_61595/g.151616  ORF Transcript_61595/g.151616 Transcript_61595/m.151616 type:complete len:282 (+) Transcript_61595:129-974(+)